MSRVNAPLTVKMGTEMRSMLIRLSGLKKAPRPNNPTSPILTRLKIATITSRTT